MTSTALPKPDITIAIVNWNTRDDLLECLESLIPEAERSSSQAGIPLDGLLAEVIVVDNNSEDGSADAVEQAFAPVQVIRNNLNLGFGKAHNQALERGRGRFRLLLNPDTKVLPGTLAKLVACAGAHAEGGIFGPRILNPDGTVQLSGRHFPTLMAGMFRHTFLGVLFPNNRYTRDYLQSDWDHSDTRQVDWVSGAAMMIREETLGQVGGLDEDYYMYVEDVDICWRAKKAGWQVWFCAESEMFHKKARASDKMPNRMLYHHHRSMYIFFRKHYWKDASLFEKIITPVGLTLRGGYFIIRNKYYQWVSRRRKKKSTAQS